MVRAVTNIQEEKFATLLRCNIDVTLPTAWTCKDESHAISEAIALERHRQQMLEAAECKPRKSARTLACARSGGVTSGRTNQDRKEGLSQPTSRPGYWKCRIGSTWDRCRHVTVCRINEAERKGACTRQSCDDRTVGDRAGETNNNPLARQTYLGAT